MSSSSCFLTPSQVISNQPQQNYHRHRRRHHPPHHKQQKQHHASFIKLKQQQQQTQHNGQRCNNPVIVHTTAAAAGIISLKNRQQQRQFHRIDNNDDDDCIVWKGDEHKKMTSSSSSTTTTLYASPSPQEDDDGILTAVNNDKKIVKGSKAADDTTTNNVTAATTTKTKQQRRGGGGRRNKKMTNNNNNTKNQMTIDEMTKKTTVKKQSKNKKSKRRDRSSTPATGNYPDISWRAIPLHHLRRHPSYTPLPPPQTLTSSSKISLYRQSSPQWSILHAGRCTTSIAPSALGLLEPIVGRELGIPSSWIRGGGLGGMSAFRRLRERVVGLEDLEGWDGEEEEEEEECVWEPMTRRIKGDNNYDNNDDNDNNNNKPKPYPFIAKYLPRLPPSSQRRQKQQQQQRYSRNDIISIRMAWGNTQESTSILTALNYFCRLDPNTRIAESGLHLASFHPNKNDDDDDDEDDDYLVGASPDGIIHYSDGRMEALEVKNHCPFASSRRRSYSSSSSFMIRDYFLGTSATTIPTLYLPQLLLEMYCLGDNCRSAIMIRQSATKGAVILRLHRDDELIDEMLYFLERFKVVYADENVEPPENFFWNEEDDAVTERYRRFIGKIGEVQRDRVEVVSFVEHRDIQRVLPARGEVGPVSLFLD